MEMKFDSGDTIAKDKRTFYWDSTLPSLPLPSIHQTIEKYLDSCKAILTDEEYKQTESICKKFCQNEAMNIQLPLMQKAVRERNWLQKWWDEYAYLKLRLPIMYYYFAGPGPYLHDFWPFQEGSQLERSAIALYNTMEVWQSLKNETFPQHKTRDGSYMTMRQFRFMFNTCRIPKHNQDVMHCSFKTDQEGQSPTHIIIFLRNRMYKIQGVNPETGNILTPPEFYAILKEIVDSAPMSYGKSISALTCLPRDDWADARQHMISLSAVNEENLNDIENAVICFCLDESKPQSYTDLYSLGLQGPCANRWSDKSFNYTCTSNGGFVATCDHSPYEALILTVYVQNVTLSMKKATRDFPKPWNSKFAHVTKELVFDVDDKLIDYTRKGLTEYNKFASNLQVSVTMHKDFGKAALKKLKIHPDGFVQICLQLTYMKMYGRPAPTYETATTRGYYNGRTETVRTCTPETVNFCKAYISGSSGIVPLFYKAHDKFVWLMEECKNGFGCDRHLMGMALQAAEIGEPTPILLSDPAFVKTGGGGNFVLSSSFTGYSDATGGVAPMVDNGYGTFYCINNNRMMLTTSSWRSCRDTNSEKFLTALTRTMNDVYDMLRNSPPAKL